MSLGAAADAAAAGVFGAVGIFRAHEDALPAATEDVVAVGVAGLLVVARRRAHALEVGGAVATAQALAALRVTVASVPEYPGSGIVAQACAHGQGQSQ